MRYAHAPPAIPALRAHGADHPVRAGAAEARGATGVLQVRDPDDKEAVCGQDGAVNRGNAMRARTHARLLGAILIAAVPACPSAEAAHPARPAESAPSVNAVWVTRHVQYVYRGMTALYTCRGLKVQIEHLLTRLGARDLRVQECAVIDQLIMFPSVRVTLQALVPAPHGRRGPTVAAHWRRVRLFPQMYEGGSCELIAEFRRTFLPLFAARDIDMDATCVPHHAVPGNHLYADVLAAHSSAARPR